MFIYYFRARFVFCLVTMTGTPSCKDIMLNVEASDVDIIYRIGRFTEHFCHVVYVTVNDSSIIPDPVDRVDEPFALRALRKYPEWADYNWKTMDLILRDDGKVVVELDREPLYALHGDELLDHLPRFNVFGFDEVYRLTYSNNRVLLNGTEYIMKLAPFSYLLQFLSREVGIYHALADHHPRLTPKLIGYVYEEHLGRVIGILCEFVHGTHPGPEDRLACLEALRALHAQGLYHGDINNRNIIVRPTGEVVFIDFETSRLAKSDAELESWAGEMQSEVEALEKLPLERSAKLESNYLVKVVTPKVTKPSIPDTREQEQEQEPQLLDNAQRPLEAAAYLAS